MCKSENDVLQKQLAELRADQRSDKPPEEASNPSLQIIPSRNHKRDSTSDINDCSPEEKRAKVSFPPKSRHDSDVELVTVYYFFFRHLEVSNFFFHIISIDLTLQSTARQTKENEENSPYLPTRSTSIFSFNNRASQRGGFSISTKKSLISSKNSDSASKVKYFSITSLCYCNGEI